MTEDRKLSSRAAAALGWSVVRYGGDQVFGFIVFAALAHRLAPAAFGVFIVGLAVAEVGKILAQGGLVSSLYRVREVTPRLADTVFWANLALALLVALACLVLRRPLAAMMGSAEAAPVIAALGFVVPVTAAGATHMSRNLREFGHRALAVRSLGAGVVGGGLALVAAQAGWGVWALVVQRFASEAIGTLVAWHAFRWRPGFDVSWSTLRAQWRLGASVAASQMLLVTLSRAQDVILARMTGIGAVGVFRTAAKANDVVTQGVISSYFSVAVPTLSKLRHDMPALRRGYLRMVSSSAMLLFPAIAGIGVLADLLIPLAFGPQWGESIPVARLLCLLAPPFALNMFADPLLTVLGRAGLIMRLTAIQLGLTVVICAAAAPYGLYWFTLACVARSYVALGLQLRFLQSATGIRAGAVLGAVAAPLAASAVMAAGVWATSAALAPLQGAPAGASAAFAAIARAGLLAGEGAAIYAAALFVLLGSRRRGDLALFARGILART